MKSNKAMKILFINKSAIAEERINEYQGDRSYEM